MPNTFHVRSLTFATRLLCASAGVAVCLLSFGACNGTDTPVAVFQTPPADMLWSLHATIPATTVAVGGTQQLGATASLLDGTPASSTPTVTYVSANPTKVQVTSSGLVTGLGVTTAPVPVVESVVTPSLTLVDTTLVSVTATAHPLKVFSIHPQPGDSNRVTLQNSRQVPLTATDSSNAAVTGLAVRYTSLSPNIFYVSGTSIVASAIGTGKLVASTVAYGVSRTDTMDYSVVNPMSVYLYCYTNTPAGCIFYTAVTVVGVGGTVNFYNYSQGPMSLTFDDTTTITGGNIVNAGLSTSVPRVFTAVGTYKVRDSNNGNSALIVVLPPN